MNRKIFEITMVSIAWFVLANAANADRQAEAAVRLFGVVEAEQADAPAPHPSASEPRRSSNQPAADPQPGSGRQNTVCEFLDIPLRDLQRLLADLDLYGGAIDGLWGRQTENAIFEAKKLINSPNQSTCFDSSDFNLLTELVNGENSNDTHNKVTYIEPEYLDRQQVREAAEVFLSDLESFIVGGGQGFDVNFPVRYSEVRDVSEANWNEVLSARFADFREFVLLNESFAEYQRAREQERVENYLRDLQQAKDIIATSLVSIRTWVGANLLDPRAAQAAQTLLLAEGFVDSPDLEYVLGIKEQVQEVIDNILGGSIPTVRSSIAPAFEVSSIFVYGNFSGVSENIYKSLRGGIEFDGSEAVICFVGEVDVWGRYGVISSLQDSLPVEKIEVISSDCIETSDLVAISGFALATEEGAPVHSKMYLEQIKEVTRDQVIQRRQRLEITSQLLEDDISRGARTGYGLISHDTSNHNVCMIISELSQDHVSAMEDFADIIGIYFGARLSYAVSTDPQEAFRKIQSRECGSVYGNEETLRILLNAFKINEMQYMLFPFWVDQQSLLARAERRREAEAQQLAFEQERQSNIALRTAALNDIASRSAIVQEELRRQHTTRFLAMTSSISDVILEAVEFGFSSSPLDLDYQERFRNLEYSDGSVFPSVAFEQIIRDAQELSLAQWELQRTLVERVDYGLSQYNSRELDALVVEMQISLANRLLGEFGTYCRTIRAVLDEDFDLWRLVEIDECGNVGESWKLLTKFESRWIVPIE